MEAGETDSALGRRCWTGRRLWIGAAIVVGAATAVAVTALTGRAARVTGRTPGERIACICRLADERPSGAAAAIAAATDDPHPPVRRAALAALSAFDARPFRPRVEACLADKDPSVRAAAATTLGTFRDDAASRRLAELLGTDAPPEVHKAALLGLRRHGGRTAIEAMLQAARTHADPDVRRYALISAADATGLTLRTTPHPGTPAFAALLEMISKVVAARGPGGADEPEGTP